MTDQQEYVWIVNRFDGECAECGESLPPGSHILWVPGAPRKKSNYCAPCGEDVAGSYPPPHYWERRDADYQGNQGKR